MNSHHTSWQKIAKDTEIMQIRHAIPCMYWIQYSRMIFHVIQISLRLTKINFRPISGVRNFENFIFGFRLQHQNMQYFILGEGIRGILKIQGCYVPQKSIFDPFGKKMPARMTTVKIQSWNKASWSRLIKKQNCENI